MQKEKKTRKRKERILKIVKNGGQGGICPLDAKSCFQNSLANPWQFAKINCKLNILLFSWVTTYIYVYAHKMWAFVSLKLLFFNNLNNFD